MQHIKPNLMRRAHVNKLSMYRVVHDLLNDHQGIWSGIPVFVSAHQAFSDKLPPLNMLVKDYGKRNVGVAEDKRAAIEVAVSRTSRVVTALKTHARLTGNNTLHADVNFTETVLLRGRKKVSLLIMQKIHERGVEFAAVLADYGISSQDLQDLADQLFIVGMLLDAPRQSSLVRQEKTAKIVSFFSQIDEILNERIDPLVDILAKDHPEFARMYGKARKVINHGGRHKPATKTEGAEDEKGVKPPERDDGNAAASEDKPAENTED